MRRILVAMSGGVDSAAACLLLKKQGYEVGGATMLLRDGGEAEAEDARRAAEQMGIDFHLFDLRREFQENVIDEFTRVYQTGGTPNPCVVCNRTMKFGIFLDKALALGYDGIATGHYACVEERNGRYLLRTASDRAKDQTYMLCGLSQWQLAHTIFPLGVMQSKAEIRALAEQAGLELSHKHDSQDICFVPDGDYMAYLTAHGLVPQAGNFITADGKILAPHAGMEAYTTGQRRGLGIALGQRTYVLGKRGTDVVLGDEAGLFARRVAVGEVNYLPFEKPEAPMRVQAKLRYTTKFADALLLPTDDGCELRFDTPQRAATPGQTAAFYDGEYLVGGGTILGSIEASRNKSTMIMEETNMKKLIAILLSLTMALCLFAGCKEDETANGGKHHVEIEVENYGTITVELDADAAPITVENFLKLTNEGFYNGLTFHRIMEGFMMQGGDPEGTGFGGSGETIKGEFSANGVKNPLSHTRGAISMARNSLSMDSASSQFFIVHQDSTFLDGQYACFGYVTSGMDVVDAICKDARPTDGNGSIAADQQPVITEIRVID